MQTYTDTSRIKRELAGFILAGRDRVIGYRPFIMAAISQLGPLDAETQEIVRNLAGASDARTFAGAYSSFVERLYTIFPTNQRRVVVRLGRPEMPSGGSVQYASAGPVP